MIASPVFRQVRNVKEKITGLITVSNWSPCLQGHWKVGILPITNMNKENRTHEQR